MATGWGRRMRVKAQSMLTTINTTYGAFTPEVTTGSFFKAGLCTVATSAPFLDDGSSATAGGTEPTIGSNGYARQDVSFAAVGTPANDAAAVATNTQIIAFTSVTGGFSTGASVINTLTLWNVATTVVESAFCARAPLSNPVAVSAAGITISIAISALTLGIISA
jgi:hypothetical protein